MICKKCEEQGLKSKVYINGGMSTTLMGSTPYYDEDGNWHNHNPNTLTSRYYCSNDHIWQETYIGNCDSCDYGKGTSKVVYL